MTELLMSIVGSVMAGLATLLIAIFYQRIFRQRRTESSQQRDQLEVIAQAVQTEESARKAAVVERVVERIPIGLTAEQFSTLLQEIGNRIPPSPETRTAATSAVESLVNNYHEQALDQAKAQFWFSVAAATVGFVWILIKGLQIAPENLATASKILPGIVMDAAAFLFFRQATETRQRATELYDRLRRDKQMSESAAVVASIEDTRLRSAVKAQIALHMSGLQPGPIDLSTFLSRQDDADATKTT